MNKPNTQVASCETTHTPGPWSADKWATGYTVSAPESHYSVCHLEGCNNDEANARLIAAAPDLLSACKVALATIEWLESHSSERAQASKDAIRDAIEKAEPDRKAGMTELLINGLCREIKKGSL